MRLNVLCLLLIGLLLVPGCTEEFDPEPQAASPAAQEEAPLDPIAGSGRQGAGSALGKAKETAKGTVEELQQRSAEVAEEAEEPY